MMRIPQREKHISSIVAPILAISLDIDESIFKAGIQEESVPGVKRPGYPYPAGGADVEPSDTRCHVCRGIEGLGLFLKFA
jgi:hypothetical protein